MIPAAYVLLLVPARIGWLVSADPDAPRAGPAAVGVAAVVALAFPERPTDNTTPTR